LSSVGELIDRVATVDMELDALKMKMKELGKKRSAIEVKLMSALEKQKVNKATGKLAHAKLDSRRHPSIKDMKKFNKYVKANDAFDLYQRRINSTAYFDRLKEGEEVPGVDVFERHFVKITRIRG
jgi:phage shock protein A